jgi:P2 family phage contractile tail tube protein
MTNRANLRAVLRGKNVYVEGIGFLGRVGDIELPKIEFEMAEDGNMSRKVDTGLLKPMEAKIAVYDLDSVLFEVVGSRLRDMASFVIKSSMATSTGEQSVYCEITGQVSSQEFDNLKDAGKESGIPLEISVVRYRLEIDGKPKYNIDADAMVCEINGKDHYATLRKQL